MAEEFDLMTVPGLISPDERELLRETCAKAVDIFGPHVVLVNIGIYLGGSCYCMRAGAPEATLIGADVNGWDLVQGERDILNMTLLQGDSKETHKSVTVPVHVMFVDGDHSYRGVKADILNWVRPFVIEGGYVIFHDAFYEKSSSFYNAHKGIAQAIEELIVPDSQWEEQEKVDSIRWFRRI